MICTGTGSGTDARDDRVPPAPSPEAGATGKLMLFFGARTKEELPYFGPLTSLPKDFIDTNLAFSRTPVSRSAMCRTPCVSVRSTSRIC